MSRERLLTEGFLGLGAPHPRLSERIGDYALLMREDYVIRDRLVGEAAVNHRGVHGGASAEELYVPLVVATSPEGR